MINFKKITEGLVNVKSKPQIAFKDAKAGDYLHVIYLPPEMQNWVLSVGEKYKINEASTNSKTNETNNIFMNGNDGGMVVLSGEKIHNTPFNTMFRIYRPTEELNESLVNVTPKKYPTKIEGDYPNGLWSKKEYDKNGNCIYWESSSGDWAKKEFDKNRHEIYYEDSDGHIEDRRNRVNESLVNVKSKQQVPFKDARAGDILRVIYLPEEILQHPAFKNVVTVGEKYEIVDLTVDNVDETNEIWIIGNDGREFSLTDAPKAGVPFEDMFRIYEATNADLNEGLVNVTKKIRGRHSWIKAMPNWESPDYYVINIPKLKDELELKFNVSIELDSYNIEDGLISDLELKAYPPSSSNMSLKEFDNYTTPLYNYFLDTVCIDDVSYFISQGERTPQAYFGIKFIDDVYTMDPNKLNESLVNVTRKKNPAADLLKKYDLIGKGRQTTNYGREYWFPYEAKTDLDSYGIFYEVDRITNPDHPDYNNGKKYLVVNLFHGPGSGIAHLKESLVNVVKKEKRYFAYGDRVKFNRHTTIPEDIEPYKNEIWTVLYCSADMERIGVKYDDLYQVVSADSLDFVHGSPYLKELKEGLHTIGEGLVNVTRIQYYYSLLDLDTGVHLHTGRNSKTLFDLRNDLLEYLSVDYVTDPNTIEDEDDEASYEDWLKILSITDTEELANMFNFEVEKHKERIFDDYYDLNDIDDGSESGETETNESINNGSTGTYEQPIGIIRREIAE